MNPILLDLGIIKIYWYSICIFLGMLFGGYMVLAEARRYKIPDDFITNLFFWEIIISVIGARLYYVAFNFSYYQNNLIEIFKIWEGGLAIHGGLIAGVIFALLYARKYRIKPMFLLDLMVVGLILGQALGRWGNFFNGECHGGVTTLATLEKFHLPDFIINGMYINGEYYVPLFLIESLSCFIGLIFILIMRRRQYNKVGQTTSIYLFWYGVTRLIVEQFRTDSLMLGNIKMAQLISIIMIILGIVLFFVLGRGSKLERLYKDYQVADIKF